MILSFFLSFFVCISLLASLTVCFCLACFRRSERETMSSALSKRQEEAAGVLSAQAQEEEAQLNVGGSSSAQAQEEAAGVLSAQAQAQEEAAQLNVEGSSSVATTKKFKVFMNHRGPDTKDTIAHHVYDMLTDRGVEVFLDIQEMSPGQDVSDQILQAISTSQVQIAIISPNYAESKWCLIELVKMMDKHNNKTSLLIPVFYDVEPAHLKFLDKSEFGNKLNQKHIDRETPERIEQWKKALKQVAEISGFTSRQYKGQLGRRIVDTVCEYMKIGRLHVSENVMGIENLLIEKEEEIMRQREKVTCVEIYGIGGIGKTTFAQNLFNDICLSFKRCCFIEDVKGILEKDGIMHLQKILLRELLHLRDIHLASSGQGKARLVEGLEKEEILVVFDNVDRECSLSEIFIEDCGVLRPSSKIVVTSRESGVIKTDSKISKSSEVIEIAMPKLDFTTSKELFCREAFGADGTYTDKMFDSFIDKIVQKCDGIPLGLKLFGKHVFGQEISFWNSFWKCFKDSMPSNLAESLHITYDGLENLEKKIFLDVAIFFIGDEEKLVKYTWANDKGCYQVDLALHQLKRKLLIEITEDGYFKMHDILRDLGRAIVDKEDEENPGRRSRLWRKHDVISVLSDEDGTEKVEGLSLVSGGMGVLKDDGCPWEIDAIAGMSSLRVLILKDKCLQGDLSQLPKRIAFLRWDIYPYDSLPILPKFSKVVRFHRGKQRNLWDPQAKVAATKLKVLNIHGSRELQLLPENLGHMFSVEYLDLSFCEILNKLPESLCDMKQLKYLLLEECGCSVLPEDMGLLENLCKLDLTHCIYLEKLPDSFGKLKQLKELLLPGCQYLEQLPESLGQLSNLEFLDLSRCRNLRKLPDSLGDMKKLKGLLLEKCGSLELLPENIGQLKNLCKLHLINCTNLQKLPDSIGQLENLCKLDLTYCSNLKKLPDSFGELKQLKELPLFGCHSLEQLPESLGQLSRIESLDLSYCRSLRKLPESLIDIKKINHLLLRSCESLEFLPENIGQLENLCKVDLIGCTNLKKLPDSFSELKQLKELLLSGCQSLERLPEGLGQLSNIESLDLSYCRSLRNLPKSLGDMKQINHLSLTTCGSLEFLPENIGQLENLCKLVLTDCTNLKKLPDSFGGLKQLKKLYLPGCHSLEQLPEGLGQLSSIESLHLSSCTSLRSLPESLGDMKKINYLLLAECGSLEFLPENIGKLENLCKVNLTDCKNLKKLPDSFGELKQLKELLLSGCQSLEQLPKSLGQLSSIESLDLSYCRNLRKLPESLGDMKQMKHLILKGCGSLEFLPENIGQLKKLCKLELSDCTNLRKLPDSLWELKQVKKRFWMDS